MNRRDVLKGIVTIAGSTSVSRLLAGCAVDSPLLGESSQALSTNVQLLGTTTTRTTWSHIVPGRWSSSAYDGLLMYDKAAGDTAFYELDGQGHLVNPPLQQFKWRTTWSHIVPGRFDDSGGSGLFAYDPTDGTAALYATDHGAVYWQTQWTTPYPWTHIIPGFFTADMFTSLLFYSQSDGYAELWRTNGIGPYQPQIVNQFQGWRKTWTKIIPGSFGLDEFTQLLFCQADGYSEWWTLGGGPQPTLIGTQTLPASTSISAGNFGGLGFTDLLLHDNATGHTGIHTLNPYDDPDQFHEYEDLTASGISASVDILSSGHFWLSNPDDQCFHDGPKDYQPGDGQAERRAWKVEAGPFLDFLAYNRNAGSLQIYSHMPVPRPVRPLEGYISCISNHHGTMHSSGSVLPNESIKIHISSTASYSISIYRASSPTTILFQHDNLMATGPHPVSITSFRDGAQWPIALTIPIPPLGWPSDLYIARVTSTLGELQLPFVVRSTGAPVRKVLVVIPDANDEAYNMWGGRSLYAYDPTRTSVVTTWPNGIRAPFALKVHFDRPFFHPFDQRVDAKWNARVTPLLRWLTGFGIDYDVITNRDLDIEQISTTYRQVIFPEHHEYWSANMRTFTSNFMSAGGNVAFLCANTCWWQVRFTSDHSAMYCYRNKGFDPILATSPSKVTVNWFDTPVNQPESWLTGLSYGSQGPQNVLNNNRTLDDYVELSYTVNPGRSSHWMLATTDLADGSMFGPCSYGSVVGSELDHFVTTSPGNWDSLATVTYQGARAADLGYFLPTQSSGGKNIVFNAGVIDWIMGLTSDPTHFWPNWLPMDQITLNVVTGLGGVPNTVPGNGLDIAIGANGTIWSTSASQTIQRWNGSSWTTMPGNAVRIAVDGSGNAWVVNGASEILRWTGSTWEKLAGAAFDIGAGGGMIWVTGIDGLPYYWSGSAFIAIDGGGSRIAVDPTGNPWVVTSAGDLYRRVGGAGGSWTAMAYGFASDVGIGNNGHVWFTGRTAAAGGHRVFRCYYGDASVWPRYGCISVGGVNIAAAPDGTPWFTNDANQFIRYA